MKEGSKYSATVRIDAELLERIRQLASETGESNATIVNAAVRYALDFAEIHNKTVTIEVKTVVFK